MIGTFIALMQAMASNPEKKISAQAKKKKGHGSHPSVTLRGVVIPVDWDSEGNVIATAISTHHEDEYLIVDEANIIGVNNLINEEVEITGTCKKKGGKKIIKIKTCTRPAPNFSDNNV